MHHMHGTPARGYERLPFGRSNTLLVETAAVAKMQHQLLQLPRVRVRWTSIGHQLCVWAAVACVTQSVGSQPPTCWHQAKNIHIQQLKIITK